LGFRLNVGFIHATWGVEYKDSYQIKCLNINNWNYAANALDYWTLNVIYITLGASVKYPIHEWTDFNPESLVVGGVLQPSAIPELSRLPVMPFDDYKNTPDETGIYIICEAGRVLYVGQTLRYSTRITKSHQRYYQITSLHPNAEVRFLMFPWWLIPEPEDDPDGEQFKREIVRQMKLIEGACIEKFKPCLN
jgi:hypothetical protein